MMHMIEPHSLTKTGVPLKLTSMSMDIKERDSTATVTLDDRADMSVRDITKMWFYDDDTPGKNLVWRARSLNEAYHTKTPVIQLEHIISTLKDTILFKEITPATITGNKDAKTVSAKDTIKYLLKQQTTADWTLSAFECTDVSQGYSFEGETIFDALVTVSSTLEDCWWEYSTNSYPFKLYIRKL